MSKELDRSQDFFSSENETGDALWKYVQSLSSETISQLSKPDSIEVFQVMEQNVIGLLGSLPSEHFNVTISTSRDHLGKLLASAIWIHFSLSKTRTDCGETTNPRNPALHANLIVSGPTTGISNCNF